MKTALLALVGAAAFAGLSAAGPLQPQLISGDARWVAHLDVDGLLKSRLGEQIGRTLLDPKLKKGSAKLKQQFDIEFDWRKIQSITAYGWEFHDKKDMNGVLVIRTEMDLAPMLDQILDQVSQAGAGEFPVRKLSTPEGEIYAVQNEAFACVAKPGVYLLSRTQADLQKGLKVVGGSTPSLVGRRSFGNLQSGGDAAGDGFLVVGVAEGFSDSLDLPKQARVLKEASGARLRAGEKADRVFVSLALDTKTSETATQIQQLAQGLIALAALNGDANPELQQLASTARVNGADKQVTLSLDLPVTNVLARITQEQPKRRASTK